MAISAQLLGDNLPEIGLPDDYVALISAVSDYAFVTDREGVVQDVIWNADAVDGFDPSSLIGVSMASIVTSECKPKIAEMLRVQGQAGDGRRREINHRISDLPEFPVRYNVIAAGRSVIFLGQEIQAIVALQSKLVQAQRALDEDYSRLRQLETQYRVLFQTSSEGLLVLDADTGRIEDVNAAAGRALGREAPDVTAQPFEALFAEDQKALAHDALSSVSATGQSRAFQAATATSAGVLDFRLSIFRAASSTMALCAIRPAGEGGDGDSDVETLLAGMAARIPDAMVLADEEGVIRWCNDAFLGMSEIALAQQAEGELLERFLGRPGVDLNVIIGNVREHGRLRAFSSVLKGAYGSETQVEISVAVLADPKPMIGFVMRDISRYDQGPARRTEVSPEAAQDLMKLVGSVPLKDLVRASTEEIEKMCIETALKKTGDNRASAAEMLGLSRQSLYVKLRRFGLLDRDGS